MPYHFVPERSDYTDFAGGQVFVTAPGQPGFPVRLASELFQRCLAARQRAGCHGPCTLYDPCCGSAYLLSALAYLHGSEIRRIVGSDVEEGALELARRNLALTTLEGLAARIAELQTLHRLYGKASHAASLESAERLRQRLTAREAEAAPAFRLFRADATHSAELVAHLEKGAVEVVLTDVPYGRLSSWQANEDPESENNPITQMLQALRPLLSAHAVVAIATDKQQKVVHPAYQRIERFQVGKRRLTLLQPLEVTTPS